MKKLIAAVVMVAAASLAHAGWNWTVPVLVDVKGRNAQGSMGGAHNSADPQEYIACGLTGWAGGRVDVNCWARDTAGRFGTCGTSDPALVSVAATINPISYLLFEWDVNGQCTRIYVLNGSTTTPPR